MRKRIDTNLMVEFSEMTACEAGQLMEDEFGEGKVAFTYPLTGRTATGFDIIKQKGSNLILATDVSPIMFYGGPPGKRMLFRGSLLTMLLDRVLYKWVTHNEYSELVLGNGELQRN